MLTRRRFLQGTGLTGGLAIGGGLHSVLSSCSRQMDGMNVASGNAVVRAATRSFNPDLEIDLQATPTIVKLMHGQATKVWSYKAKLLKGDVNSLQTLPDRYLGPILRVRQGQQVRVNFKNNLPAGQPTVVHWHGLILPDDMDGHPRFAIQPGQTYVYEFEVVNRAGTNWFHPHPDRLTGGQVYAGLAGLFLVTDDEEAALRLPTDSYDLPIVLQDRTLDAENQLVYLGDRIGAPRNNDMESMVGMNHGNMNMSGGMDNMMDRMMGFLGQDILVNGQLNHTLSVATRIYRLRFLNGSNARIYKLAWSNREPLIAIATDGSLLPKPIERPYIMLAPGERVDIWADFSKMKVGSELSLNSLPFSGAEDGESSAMNMQGMKNTLPLGAAMTLFKVKVKREEKETLRLPDKLATLPLLKPEEAINASRPRPVTLSLKGMQWVLNETPFEMNAVATNEVVKLNTVEQWEIINQLNPGAMMDANGMAHPIHLHGVQFQVMSRDVLPQLAAGWGTVKDGYIDAGLQDTVMVMPGEHVKLLMKFEKYSGLFTYHCHNLEHEDAGMMRNYRIAA
jgi:FtsP/CotA-like multicopper oxidase with cupredoxin domain